MEILTAITGNTFEAMGLIQPRLVLTAGAKEGRTGRKPLQMRWVQDTTSDSREAVRIQWIEEIERAEVTASRRRSD
jgi:hypothetical protein